MDKSDHKRKNYKNYKSGGSNHWNSKKKFRNYLEPGMKGFFCTCNMREKDCVREAYNVLNEYADKLYGSNEIRRPVKNEEPEGAGVDDSGDIEDELKKEVSELKANKWSPGRFNVADTGVPNNIFIKTTLEDPVHLAYSLLNDVAETKTQKARFLMRVVPVEVICKANLEEIKKAADGLFDKHFRCEPTTFAVVVNKRYNDSVLRDELIHALALLVTDKNKEHKANLKDAKMTVLLEIMKGLCCVSVLQDYKRLRHYNLAELAKPESAEAVKPEPTEPEGPEKIESEQTEEKSSAEDGMEENKLEIKKEEVESPENENGCKGDNVENIKTEEDPS